MKLLNEILKKKVAVFAFGRMNPPTAGHEKLVNKILSVADSRRAAPFLFVSHSQDPKKNPLNYEQKGKYISLGMPKIANHLIQNQQIKNPFDALKYLQSLGYTDIIMIAGSDRVAEYEKSIRPYIDGSASKKLYDFDSFNVVSAGDRDPDSESSSGISGTKMRNFAAANDFTDFLKGVPSGLSTQYSKNMFIDVRHGMKIAESLAANFALREEYLMLPDSLNISRPELPQISAKNTPGFISYLKSKNINVIEKEVSIDTLRPIQNKIDIDLVRRKYDQFANGSIKVKPMIVSSDNHIIDGHHQMFALQTLDRNFMVFCYVVELPIHLLIRYAKEFLELSPQ